MNKFWSVKNFVNQDGTGQSELILYGDISDTSGGVMKLHHVNLQVTWLVVMVMT